MKGQAAFIYGGLAFLTTLLATPCAAKAQLQPDAKKIGMLYPMSPPREDDPVRGRHARYGAALYEELRALGWVEGKNLVVERRYSGGRIEALPQIAAEFVALKVDVIYALTGTAAIAATTATKTIPIVALVGDMVELGLVSNLARPDSNVTGQSIMSPELAGKRLHLLRELLPSASRIAVLGCGNVASPGAMGLSWRSLEAVARALNVQLVRHTPETPEEIEAALKTLSKQRPNGLVVLDCPRFNALIDKRVFLNHRLPAIYYVDIFARYGGLMAYSPDDESLWRRSGWYIGRILNGAKPADLPVEQPTKLRLVINLKTARALGLSIPPTLLLRADEVIE